MTSSPSYAVVGAGNGGCALAAELALLGREVVLFDHPEFEARLQPLRALGGIHVESRVAHFAFGIGTHFARLAHLTTDPSAVTAAKIVAVVVPGQHHGRVIDALLPHLRPEQLVLLAPGGVGGTLLWADRLRRTGLGDVLLAQTADLSYAGYRTPEAKVVVGDKKKRVFVGVFPNNRHREAMARLEVDFPELVLAANALDAGLQGPGMLVHPLPMLMNAVRIDRDYPFTYDAYDITPSVARAVSTLDRERMAIVAALGGEVKPIEAILGDYYGVSGADFYDTVRKVPAYRGSAAPKDFSHRYIAEEVPTQIVPACSIARVLGVPTPVMEATAALASAVTGERFGRSGWTSERLGIAKYDRIELLRHLETG
jgi:opine dehydrogenase